MEFMKHQIEAADAVEAAVSAGESRFTLLHAYGSGKAATSWLIASRLKAKTVVVGSPQVSKLAKVATRWGEFAEAAGIKLKFIGVCSGGGSGDAEDGGGASLSDLGIIATRDVATVTSFLTGDADCDMRVVLTTYASSDITAAAVRDAQSAGGAVDLVFLGDGHRMAGREGSQFTTLARSGEMDARMRVFLTPIVRTYKGGVKEAISMRDEDVFGRFHSFSIKQSLELGLILPVSMHIIQVSEAEIKQAIEGGSSLKMKNSSGAEYAVYARSAAASIGAERIMRKGLAKHAITYHTTVSGAATFAEMQDKLVSAELRSSGTCFGYVHGEMPAKDWDLAIKRFRHSERGIISCCKALVGNAGLPFVDLVVIVDPRDSTAEVLELVRGAIRPHGSKTCGHVLVAVAATEGASIDEVLGSPEWRKVFRVTDALQSMLGEDFTVALKKLSTASEYGEDAPDGPKEAHEVISLDVDVHDFVVFAQKVSARATGVKTVKIYKDFKEARDFVRSLGFKFKYHFDQWTRSGDYDPTIHKRPQEFFDEFISWEDFLGTGFYRRIEAEEVALAAGVTTAELFHQWSNSSSFPRMMPRDIWHYFGEEWTLWDARPAPPAPSASFLEELRRKRAAVPTEEAVVITGARAAPPTTEVKPVATVRHARGDYPDFPQLRRAIELARKQTGRKIASGAEYQEAVLDGVILGPLYPLEVYPFSMKVNGEPSWVPLLGKPSADNGDATPKKPSEGANDNTNPVEGDTVVNISDLIVEPESFTPQQVFEVVNIIKNDAGTHYNKFYEVVGSIHAVLRAEYPDDAREIAENWASRSPKFVREKFASMWSGLDRNPYRLGGMQRLQDIAFPLHEESDAEMQLRSEYDKLRQACAVVAVGLRTRWLDEKLSKLGKGQTVRSDISGEEVEQFDARARYAVGSTLDDVVFAFLRGTRMMPGDFELTSGGSGGGRFSKPDDIADFEDCHSTVAALALCSVIELGRSTAKGWREVYDELLRIEAELRQAAA